MGRLKKMEKKKKTWEDFSLEEKQSLLNHWFYYYGGAIMTLKEMDDFRKLASQRADDIFSHIVTNYVFNHTIQSNLLLNTMRAGKVDELFALSITPDKVVPGKENVLEDIRLRISDEILGSFVCPEPPIPMDVVIMVDDTENGNQGRSKK